MKIFCHNPGDPSVGIWPGDITIEIHGMKEEDYCADELDEILKAAKEFSEITFGEKTEVVIESQMEEEEEELKQCEAMIWHGPGHQSKTHCQVKGEHTIHEARYGSYDQYAKWEGDKVFSGYFDDPPEFPAEKKE